MTFDEFRRELVLYRRSADDDAKSLKDTYITLERLHALYRTFDATERQMADDVLGEWALSEDEGVRFDALSLIDDMKIDTAVGPLRELARRLSSSTAPSAPYELKKVLRVITGLEASGTAK